jgi:chromosome segregation ATPase
MKLTELATPKKSRQVAKVFESYFGTKMPVNKLTVREAQAMLKRVRGVIAEHQRSPSRHTSERNPAYLKLVMMEQALAQRIQEQDQATPAQAAAMRTAQIQQARKSINEQIKQLREQKAEIEDKIRELQQQANNPTMMESSHLTESEVQQAQVVLAAQDMVDNVQGMIEDATEMQFKELPALVDQIKNQVGPDQAAQFNNDASAALGAVVQSLQGSKQQLDTALGVVTGQPSPAMPAAGAAMPGALGNAMMPPADADIDTPDMDQELDVDLDVEEPQPARAALGRERRK